ncbi:MAG: YhjD/YihY/BrkB family envelope integrity protein [Myxococcota bacterium]
MDLAHRRWLGPVAQRLQGLAAEPRQILRAGMRPHEPLPPGTRMVLGVYLLVETLRKSAITEKAGATAYSLVFSLIPLITTTLALFTAMPGLESERESLRDAAFQHLLPSAVHEVQTYVHQFTERAAQTGVVSSLVFVAVVLLVLKHLERVFNSIWRVPRQRTWSQRVQVLALFFLVGSVAVATMVSITRELFLLREHIEQLGILEGTPLLPRVTLEVGNVFVACALFTLANRVLPNTTVRWRPAVLGGVLAGVVFSLLKAGFTWYLDHFASYQNIYGALGLIPAFFLWVYLSMLVLMLGGHISFISQNLRPLLAIHHAGKVEPCLAYHAIVATTALARAFHDVKGPQDAETLARQLGVSTYLLEQSMVPLCRAGVVVTLTDVTPARYVLAQPPENITVGRLVALATGEELAIPDVEHTSALHDRVVSLFASAGRKEGSVLERVTVADLVPDAPTAV